MISPSFEFEKSLLPSDARYILGLDEVGRGPWAGPVTVGAFLIELNSFNPETFHNLGVRDSKMLSPRNRQKIYSYFQSQHFTYKTFSSSSKEIDEQGIGQVIKNLFKNALSQFSGRFDFAIIDGNLHIESSKYFSVVGADKSCFSVASASIVAKFIRDKEMNIFDQVYPQYGFASHKGYGTKAHLEALKAHGPSPIHRFSYNPIKNLLNTNNTMNSKAVY